MRENRTMPEMITLPLGYGDVRRAPGGMQIALGPDTNGMPYIVRVEQTAAIALKDAMLANTRFMVEVNPADDRITAVLYAPYDDDHYGSIARVEIHQPTESLISGISWEAPDADWPKLAAAIQDVERLPMLSVTNEEWRPESFHLCQECGRPVFESASTVMITGGMGFLLLCEPCAAEKIKPIR
jgi:hypothetical protein